ncbi:arsenic metallochaperone ArsD family protein [Caproiciproducens sp. R1]|uniref:arsenic metallochaperone ArsD family protein n=1 Tax=Caproiciproducens sp. R1 TaxID=3435000 RepID=UPI0040337BC9
MKTMRIFESALGCTIGLRNDNSNSELIRFKVSLKTLEKNDIKVECFNLLDLPMEFINNKSINKLINNGERLGKLPIIVLDDEIVFMGRYPTNDELATLLNIPVSCFN